MLDIIFDGRNKEYGAYELRRTYSKRISKAMLITSIVVGLGLGGVVLANSSRPQRSTSKMGPEVILAQAVEPPREKMPEPEKTKPQEQPQVKEVAFTPPKVMDNDLVNNPPPTTDEANTGLISDQNKNGITPTDVPYIEPQPPGNGTGLTDKKPEPDVPDFVPIEIDAKFDGNWPAFLQRNLVAEVPANNGAPAGRYKVEIKFVIDESGNIISAEALTHLGYGLEEEAIRVIKKANGKWQAPYQNGVRLKATMRQTIIFEVQDEG